MSTVISPQSPSPTRRQSRTRLSGAPIGPVELGLIFAVLLAGCGHLMIKYGLAGSGVAALREPLASRILTYLLLPRVVMGLVVYGFGTLLWIAVVAKREISYLYPITALNYVFIGLGGMWLFGEPVPPLRWVGIAVVMLGVALMQTSRKEQGT